MKKLLVLTSLVLVMTTGCGVVNQSTEISADKEVMTITLQNKEDRVNYLKQHITNEVGLEELTMQVIDELLLLPDWLYVDFFEEGETFVITDTMPEGHKTATGNFNGRYDGQEIIDGTAVISINTNWGMDYSVLHEVGHYYYYEFGVVNDTEFKNCYSEMQKFVDEFCKGDSYYLDEREFFAEAFSNYIKGNIDSTEYPLIVEEFDRVMETYN